MHSYDCPKAVLKQKAWDLHGATSLLSVMPQVVSACPAPPPASVSSSVKGGVGLDNLRGKIIPVLPSPLKLCAGHVAPVLGRGLGGRHHCRAMEASQGGAEAPESGVSHGLRRRGDPTGTLWLEPKEKPCLLVCSKLANRYLKKEVNCGAGGLIQGNI